MLHPKIKKALSYSAFLCLLLPLTACQASPGVQDSAPVFPVSASQDAPTSADSTGEPDPFFDPSARVLPWTAPERAALPADEFFAAERNYTLEDFYHGGSYAAMSPCEVISREKAAEYLGKEEVPDQPAASLFLCRWQDEAPILLWPLTETPCGDGPVGSPVAGEKGVYWLSADGTQLLFVDFLGQTQQTLYTDPAGTLNDLWCTQEVLFFTVRTGEDTRGCCRLYLADGSLSMLYDKIPQEATVLPASNLAVEWSMLDPEFVALRDQRLQTYMDTYSLSSEDAVSRIIHDDPAIREVTRFYYNAQTEQLLQVRQRYGACYTMEDVLLEDFTFVDLTRDWWNYHPEKQ